MTAAAKENGGDTDEMEAEAAAVAADDDPTGVLASLIVEHANLLQRFKMSGWNLEKLRQRARELGFTDDTISATEAAGESNPDSSPKKALLQLILDGLATNMRLRLKNKELVELLEDAKEESLDLKEIQKALDSDNPKAALLALILQRAKAAEGAQVGVVSSVLQPVYASLAPSLSPSLSLSRPRARSMLMVSHATIYVHETALAVPFLLVVPAADSQINAT